MGNKHKNKSRVECESKHDSLGVCHGVCILFLLLIMCKSLGIFMHLCLYL